MRDARRFPGAIGGESAARRVEWKPSKVLRLNQPGQRKTRQRRCQGRDEKQSSRRKKQVMNTITQWNPFRTTRWNPFRELAEFGKGLERYFQTGHELYAGGNEPVTAQTWEPAVDITEDDKEFLVKAELPEMKKEDVKVIVEDHILRITGERKFENEENGKKYHRIERGYGAFTRAFTLPEGADDRKVTAEFKDGILRVHLPKNGEVKPKGVEVPVK